MPTLATNKKAPFDYQILETIEAGIILKGYEVKSVKAGRAKLQGAHGIVRGEEVFIVGMHIPPYQAANTPPSYDPGQTRKLLLTKKEINYLIGKSKEQGLTLVPLRVYTKRGLVKVVLGLAKGKKKRDKREGIRKREEKRRMERLQKSF